MVKLMHGCSAITVRVIQGCGCGMYCDNAGLWLWLGQG